MTALEKALEMVKENQKELRKLKGTNSESTSQEKSGIVKRCDAKSIIGPKRPFKGNPPILPYFAVITESCPPSKKNADKCRTG